MLSKISGKGAASIIEVFCDGLCEPNPGGVATYGWVAYKNGKKIHDDCCVICAGDGATNNVAEYSAVISAMGWLLANSCAKEKVVVQTDSQLCIRQLNGLYKVKAPLIVPLYREAKNLSRKFKNISFRWIPREKNAEADALSRKAYNNYGAAYSLSREGKADLLVGAVSPVTESKFRVASQSVPGLYYDVDLSVPACDCPDFLTRKRKIGACKHIIAAEKYLRGVAHA